MTLPLMPVAHNILAEYGLNVGYDCIRQSSVAFPDFDGMPIENEFKSIFFSTLAIIIAENPHLDGLFEFLLYRSRKLT